VPLIEGEHVRDIVAISEYHDRGVGHAERKIRVLVHNGKGRGHVIAIEWLELVGTSGYLLEQGYLGFWPNSGGQEIVELGQHERRQQERWLCRLQRSDGFWMSPLA
jgi:hypothetical protein